MFMTGFFRGILTAILMAPLAASAQTAGTDGPAQHHGNPERHAAMVACRPVIRSSCKDIDRKGGRIWACLASSGEPLTADCRQALAAFAASKPAKP